MLRIAFDVLCIGLGLLFFGAMLYGLVFLAVDLFV